MFILAHIVRRRTPLAPVVVVGEVDDMIALAVAVGVLTSPTVQSAR